MKLIYIAALAAVTAMITTVVFTPRVVSSQSYTRIPFESIKIKAPSAQEVWLNKLVMCESTGNPNAINKVDRDGTPSYGLLQFKPSTFEYFARRYGVSGTLMEPEAQKKIVRQMMNDRGVDWLQQFPDCVKNHIGFPPKKG